MNQPFVAKLLDRYAAEVSTGYIVELGTYHGAGTIALARAAQRGKGAIVYTVDDFKKKHGWIGEPYVPEDKVIFEEAVREAEKITPDLQIALVEMDFHEASLEWDAPIGLWYWDPGMTNRFWNDWIDWKQYIVHGGIAILKDTAQGHLGTNDKIRLILGTGQFIQASLRDGVCVLKKR